MIANVFLRQEPMSEMERGETVSETAVAYNVGCQSLLIDLSSQLYRQPLDFFLQWPLTGLLGCISTDGGDRCFTTLLQ